MNSQNITIIGAGILGLWQALHLARAGHRVTLLERSYAPFTAASSWLAGAMLAPFCEAEPSQPELTEMALKALELWRNSPCDVVRNGTLIVAAARDRAELTGFAKRSRGYERVRADKITLLEPDIATRFHDGLFYEEEAHVAPRQAMAALLLEFKNCGGEVRFGFDAEEEGRLPGADITIDTRGMGAASDLKDLGQNLRPVRGEMAVVRAKDVTLSRPVRLLHPRVPCYIVPWPDHHFMIGATVIESDDKGPVTVRSGLELLGAAFSVHPGFGEGKIVELNAGLRPSLPDNLPKIVVNGDYIHVNGAYRHGFLLAPLLAAAVNAYISGGDKERHLFQ